MGGDLTAMVQNLGYRLEEHSAKTDSVAACHVLMAQEMFAVRTVAAAEDRARRDEERRLRPSGARCLGAFDFP